MSRTKQKKQAKLKRQMASIRRANKKEDGGRNGEARFAAMQLVNDPQAFAETLFVTSCAFDDTVEGNNAVDLARTEPNAGAVFAVDVGVRGAPTHAAAF